MDPGDTLATPLLQDANMLRKLGVPTRLFRPSDFGVPTLGLTYLTRQELVDKDASALERFVKATLRGIHGWTEAMVGRLERIRKVGRISNPSGALGNLSSSAATDSSPAVSPNGNAVVWQACAGGGCSILKSNFNGSSWSSSASS